MRTFVRARPAIVATLALIASFASSPALGSTATEEQQGAALTKAVNTKARSCKSLGAADFERIGQYAMGLNFASTPRHEAMNRRMSAMMGAQGGRQAHQSMGRAYSGCDSRGSNDESNQSAFGMMGGRGSSGGMMSGMMAGSAYGPGMMGSDARGVDSSQAQAAAGEQGVSTPAAVLLAVLAAALGAALLALIAPRLTARGPTERIA